MPSRTRITRRELVVAGAGVAAAASVSPAWAKRLVKVGAKVGPGTFADGVASGEPTTDAVTLWSRLTTESQRSGARLIVATDEGLRNVVRTVKVPTGAAVDGVLKARIGGLEPDTYYWYGFESATGESDIGRTKTAPPADSETQLRIAVSSCQNWPNGFFNGHRDAAAQELDLYCFLGDYTYEYGPRTGIVESRNDPAPSVDLRSYRDKLRLYRSDAALRELHRLHPVTHIWDDHEVGNNYTSENPGPTSGQRAAAYQASFEWLPRMAARDERYRAYRNYRVGQVEVFILDERQYRAEGTMLGRKQLDWFKAALTASTARWKIIANEVMFVPLGVGGVGVNPDQWDGFTADRDEILAVLQGVPNTIFLTGDIHTFFTSRVLRNGSSGRSVATEYVCGSITSSGFPALGGLETAGIFAANPWISYTNGDDHGYGLLELNPADTRVVYRAAPIDVPDAPARDLAVYRQPIDANDYETVFQRLPANPILPTEPTARELSAAQAPNRALARRRRKLESLETEVTERAEARARAASRRRKARAS